MFLSYEFGIYQTVRFAFLTAAEMLLFKVLYIYNYSRIAGVNEYFLTNFVTSFNVIITLGFSVVRIALKDFTIKIMLSHMKHTERFISRKLYSHYLKYNWAKITYNLSHLI